MNSRTTTPASAATIPIDGILVRIEDKLVAVEGVATQDDVTLDGVTPDDVTPDDVAPDDVTPDDVAPDDVAPDDVTPDEDVDCMLADDGDRKCVKKKSNLNCSKQDAGELYIEL